MKAITLFQPWASLVALGEKRYETRSWSTRYRGPVAIHSSLSKRFTHKTVLESEFYQALFCHGLQPEICPRGHIIAVCRLTDCAILGSILTDPVMGDDAMRIMGGAAFERTFGDWTTGRFCWKLEDVQLLAEPVKVRGHLGLWTLPEEIEHAVLAQMQRSQPGGQR